MKTMSPFCDKKPPLLATVGIGVLLWSSQSLSLTAYQSHESIRDTVNEFVMNELGGEENTRADLGHLDSRLRLHQCSEPLSAFWPNGSSSSGRGVVGVRCSDAKPWKMYVQVNLHVYKDVAILSGTKIKGSTLRLSDVSFERRDISRMNDRFLTDPRSVVGTELKRSLKSGVVLHAGLFKASKMVKRGQRVMLLAKAGGIEVKMAGKALSDGVLGGTVRVKNLSSSRVVEGEVVDKGVVKIRF